MTLSDSALSAARAALEGVLVLPGDDAWDDARLFHSGIGEPDAVVRVRTVDDVRAAVGVAALAGVPVMVRGGGHSAWGSLPGGLTIDLSGLDRVDVVGDRTGPVVRVGGGATWGAVAAALSPLGLALSSGDTASVGVGGLTLGGGIGWMVRAWGLACDQLVGAQLVTATGEVVEVTDETHPELLWALRGGGGNFGVVTRFDFRPHALKGVGWAELGLSGDSRVVLRSLRDILRDAPRELTATFMDVPAMDPSAPAGATVSAVWAGPDAESLRRVLAPLLALDGVEVREIATKAYPDILLDAPPMHPDEPMPGFIGGNMLVDDLDDATIDGLVSFREANEASVLFLRSVGGCYGDVGADATAFPARGASWFAMAGAFDLPGLVDDAQRVEIDAQWTAIEAAADGVYGNFTTSTDPAWATRMYPPETMSRLVAVKNEWDPTNVFSRNHNVVPA